MSVLKDCSTCARVLTYNNCSKCKRFKLWVDEKVLWRDRTEVSEWKMQYNIYLGRHKKAEQYMNDNNIPIEHREHWVNVYKSITMELDYILTLLNSDGIAYTDEEALNGFAEYTKKEAV